MTALHKKQVNSCRFAGGTRSIGSQMPTASDWPGLARTVSCSVEPVSLTAQLNLTSPPLPLRQCATQRVENVLTITDPPVPLSARCPDVPPGLEAIVLRCLEIEPVWRHPTASQLAFELAHPDQVTKREEDRIVVRRYGNTIRLLHPVGHDYYNMLREKLHWTEFF